jgi:hypothetical protein
VQGLVLRAADIFLIPFSLLWGGFAIFWEVCALMAGAPWLFSIWGIPFVVFGLYFMFGRFWVDARERAATVYAVTSERVVIVYGMFARRVKSLDIGTITDVTLTERGDSAGTITFGPVPPYYSWYSGARMGLGTQVVPCFELASEARAVYEIIRAAQRGARQLTEASAAGDTSGI